MRSKYFLQASIRQRQKVTILLTSHYMKDIAALCRRVVIIAHGKIIYDGSLSGILDQLQQPQGHLARTGQRQTAGKHGAVR